MKSKGEQVYRHLDSSVTHPVAATAPPTTVTTTTPGVTTAAAGVTTKTTPAPDLVLQWDKDKLLVLDLLTQCILDLMVIHTSGLGTAAAVWAEILHEFTTKGAFIQTELHTKFMASKCLEKGNVCTWMESYEQEKKS